MDRECNLVLLDKHTGNKIATISPEIPELYLRYQSSLKIHDKKYYWIAGYDDKAWLCIASTETKKVLFATELGVPAETNFAIHKGVLYCSSFPDRGGYSFTVQALQINMNTNEATTLWSKEFGNDNIPQMQTTPLYHLGVVWIVLFAEDKIIGLDAITGNEKYTCCFPHCQLTNVELVVRLHFSL